MMSSYIPGTHKATILTYAFKALSKPVQQRPARELEVRLKLQEAQTEFGITKLVELFEDDTFVYQVTSQMNVGTLQAYMERRSKSNR